jgi:3-hydroxyisobutyrate dehydrogenase-like beta-hydroxyacid dehydrogenase
VEVRVGFVGLGNMGGRMARNVLRAGYPLTVYNRSKQSVHALSQLGATAAPSLAEVGKTCRVVVLSLPSSQSVRDVTSGEAGLLASMGSGGIVIDTSTVEPDLSVGLARKAAEKGVFFLDAPVSGGPERAANGTLTFMVGGEKSAFEESLGLLQTMGKSIFYLGPSGSGENMKLANQALAGVYAVVTAETYRWCRAMGLDPRLVYDVITTSWGDSPVFRHSMSVINSGDLSTDGTKIKLIAKDLSIVLDAAQRTGVRMDVAETAKSVVSGLTEAGHGESGIASIPSLLERHAGPRRQGAV